MDGKVPDPARRHIDYYLTQLGVRVFDTSCQLISRTQAGWTPMGAQLPLPLKVPLAAEGLQPGNVVQETAFHIMQHDPGSDLRAMLQQDIPFSDALQASARMSSAKGGG